MNILEDGPANPRVSGPLDWWLEKPTGKEDMLVDLPSIDECDRI